MKRNPHAGRNLNKGLSLTILTEDELEEIHLGTLELLEKTGLFIEDESALDRFEEGGGDRGRRRQLTGPRPIFATLWVGSIRFH